MKKALIVTTVAATVGSFNRKNIDVLKSLGYAVTIATHFVEGGNWDFDNAQRYMIELNEAGIETVDVDFSRLPFSVSNIRAIQRIKELVLCGEFVLVHCQTPIAAAITRLACRGQRKRGLRVVYTAHGFHFYKGAPLINWLIYYPIEWLCSLWTDTLITINAEDYKRAKKHLHAKKTVYVPGVGIDAQRFQNTVVNRETKREEISVPEKCVLLLSVGELNRNKNHETVIRALARISRTDIHYAIAGKGPLEKHLVDMAEKLGVSDRVHILGFRSDVAELYKAADVFVHPSFREGLPVVLMEAMASGLPVACSRIRGNVDAVDEKGGVFFDPSRADTCKTALVSLFSANRAEMGAYNAERSRQFDRDVVKRQMRAIYSTYARENERNSTTRFGGILPETKA